MEGMGLTIVIVGIECIEENGTVRVVHTHHSPLVVTGTIDMFGYHFPILAQILGHIELREREERRREREGGRGERGRERREREREGERREKEREGERGRGERGREGGGKESKRLVQ